jgi:hypothetical protein
MPSWIEIIALLLEKILGGGTIFLIIKLGHKKRVLFFTFVYSLLTHESLMPVELNQLLFVTLPDIPSLGPGVRPHLKLILITEGSLMQTQLVRAHHFVMLIFRCLIDCATFFALILLIVNCRGIIAV